MSVSLYAAIIIIGCCLVTLLPRILPVMLFSKIKIPDAMARWLKHVPVAVMSALLVSELLIFENQINPIANILELIVAVPTVIVAYKTKSPILTVLVGVLSLMILRFLF